MNIFRLVVLASGFLFSGAAFAAPSLTPAQKFAICGKRTTCAVTAIHSAGAQQVAEIHFGLKDKPDDAPDDGCIMAGNSDKKDGGTEYWLLGAKPIRVLALCNDGYGAAGVGEDTVKFASNRMTHEEEGGSAWRWSNTAVYSLSPFRAISTDGCSYNDLGTDTGTQTRTDEVKLRAVVVAKNPGAHWGDRDEMGCPTTTPAMFANPKPFPTAKTVMAFPVISPANALLFGPVPNGTTLGACASAISTDGKNGFVVFGQPTMGNAADVQLLALGSSNILIAQIYDPAPSKPGPGRSWVAGSHLEVWSGGLDQVGPLKRDDLSQIAVDLDGTVHTVGKAVAPTVRHWQAKDGQGRPVTVLMLTWADSSGFTVGAVSYSQSDKGKQARLVTNTAMARGVPAFMPDVTPMQAKCAIKSGRIEIQ
ncbi:MAG TPA: hypothetical protein VLV55_10750 [Rhizomicrobium sp.]|nr:hypothetical protein [Rhizomicrobium sp.]